VQHNLIFAAWLVHTFGQDCLRGHRGGGSGTGVLDIAGGAGTLSYELSVGSNFVGS
jgi:L-aminopeptidase/D-esterase-like protein